MVLKRQPGGGRKPGGFKFGEPTKVVRVPISVEVSELLEGRDLPLFEVSVAAGFPSPAEDHTSSRIDLQKYLVKHPAATWIVRAKGDSMVGAGIMDGALLIVDSSLEPRDGDIVVAEVEGSFTVKRLSLKKGEAWLVPENPDFQPMRVDNLEVRVAGVVSSGINQFRTP